jgi:hypothetical protein
MRKLLLYLGLAPLLAVPCHAQKISVSSDQFTGKASVVIPLVTLSKAGVSVPVGLVYNGDGVRVRDLSGDAGMNWNVVAGGQISREVRGLPDDIKKDQAQQTRLGWLHNTNGIKISNYAIANDNNMTNCTDEATDLNYLSANFNDLSDTEPDVFHVSAPGLSCNLTFDKDHNIRVDPYQDIQVTYETDVNGQIISFHIINDKGMVYDFIEKQYTIQKAVGGASPAFFSRYFAQYGGGIKYVSAWMLSSISDMYFNQISLTYSSGDQKVMNTPVALTLAGGSTATLMFNKTFTTTYVKLTKIGFLDDGVPSGQSTKIQFTYLDNLLNQVEGLGKKFSFYYALASPVNNISGYNRPFLDSVSALGQTAIVSSAFGQRARYTQFQGYKFTYQGVSSASPATVAIPDSSSKEVDYWGYFNGSGATSRIPQVYINPQNGIKERYRNSPPGNSSADYSYLLTGVSRATNSATISNGSLIKITYIDGGHSTIAYEPNDFYDPTSGTVVQGGGIRVRQITSYDGISMSNNMVTSYNYVNPVTGLSSGKPVTLPVFAFTTPYTGGSTTQEKWINSTIRSEYDLAVGDKSIIYSHIKVSQPSGGSTLYQYSTPATNWDKNAGTDWTPTVSNVARKSCSAVSFATNDNNTYPFTYNPNFGFERGLLQNTFVYNAAGQLLRQDSTVYQRSASPLLIAGLNFEDNGTIAKNYAKYSVLTEAAELPVQVISKIYDIGSNTKYRTTTLTSSYSSTAHKQRTTTELTNSDGTRIRTNFKYVKDYAATATADSATAALFNFTKSNYNVPVETYVQQIKGGAIKTISGSLNKFKYFADGYYPWQQYQFVSPSGISDFTPSAVISGAFINDSRYRLKQTFLSYDVLSQAESIRDDKRRIETTVRDSKDGLVIASVFNARAEEVAFSDFDNGLSKIGFTTSSVKSNDHFSGGYSMQLTSNTQLTKTLKKSSLTQNYIFSARVKSSNNGSLNIQLSGGNSSFKTLPYTAQSSKWIYYEAIIPAVSLSTDLTATVSASNNILIDDVWLYPQQAQVSSMVYDTLTNQLNAQTAMNGLTTYYTYDSNGHRKHVLDDDKNIVSKITNIYFATIKEIDTVSIITNIQNYNNPSTFTAYGNEKLTSDGMSYTWNFGDGTPPVTTSQITLKHKYTLAGSFTVTLTRTSPFYSSKTVSTVAIVPNHGNSCKLIGGGVSGAEISYLQIRKNGNIVGTWTQPDLASGNYSIEQGLYDITVSVTGELYSQGTGQGYASVALNLTGSSFSPCQNRNNKPNTGAVGYQFNNVDLNGVTQMGIGLRTSQCSLPPAPIE